MPSVPSLLQVLQNALMRLENSPEFALDDPHTAQLRRWLLITIADLQDRQREPDGDSECA